MRRSNRKYALALAVAVGTAGAVLGPAQGQDAGLPLPARGGSAPSATFAPLPTTRPDLLDGFAVDRGAWRVSGREAQGGDYTGTMTFQRRGPRLFAFERRLVFASGVQAFERGEAAIHQGFLHCEQQVPQGLGGLRGAFAGAISEGVTPTRLAVYRLAPDGRRLEGRFKFTGSRRTGVERLEPLGSEATNNKVTLLVDGGEMFPALREALAGAQRSICLQTFIYRDDATGRSVARILSERARAGVEVRLLVDAFGNKLGGLARELRAAGVEVVIQHGWGEGIKNSVLGIGRSLWDGVRRLFGGKPKPRERRGLFNHDHRKIIVVDGRVAFCGGMNIGVEYEREWHDVHAAVEGSAVAQLEAMFFDRWRAAGGRGEAPPAVNTDPWPGTLAVDVVGALPGLSTEIKDRYLREIAGARHRVLIENAYFLDDDVIASMQGAVRRGVRTVLILPPDENHDVPVVRDAFAWAQNDVVRSGVELYKYRDRMVHSKVAAFDGRVATVGSSNLDNMALTLLAEANIFVMDPGFTRELEQRVFARDLPMSDRVQVRKLSWWEKVKSGTLHFFRGIL